MNNQPNDDRAPRSARSIQEFWIDFLLEEEFAVDPAFGRKFLSACDASLHYEHVDQVVHSVNDKYGEADLLVVFSRKNAGNQATRFALLIEDKITAGFQPGQARRYQDRGNAGKTDGLWTGFLTVLVAPEAYMPKEKSHGFDVTISLERIKEWICLNEPARREFRQKRLDEAISKRNATGVQFVDPEMTSFRAAYFDNLQRFNSVHGTDFHMRPPKDTYFGDT